MKLFKSILLFVLCFGSFFCVNAQYTTAQIGDFDDPTSWVGGTVPPAGSDITIAHDLNLNQDFDANSVTVQNGIALTTISNVTLSSQTLTLEPNSELILGPGAVLSVSGNITNDGSLYFQSDGTNGSAQFDEFNGTIIGSGEATVERFIPAKRIFHFHSSAVNTAGSSKPSINDNWQEGATSNTDNPNPGYGIHITGSPTGSNGFDQTPSGAPSMFTFDNTFIPTGTQTQSFAYSFLPNTDLKEINAGEPYFGHIRGDRSINVLSNSSPPTNTILRATGDLHTGSLTFDVGNPTSHLNLNSEHDLVSLIANPYQAVVDYSKVSRDDLTDYIYAWDVNLGGAVDGSAGFVTVEIPSTVGAAIAPNPGLSPVSQFLAPGMPFFVQNLESGSADITAPFSPTITFEEDDKATNEPQVNVFSAYSNFYINSRIYTTSNQQNGNRESDALGLRFSSSYTTLGSNTEDATKRSNSRVNYAVDNNGLRSIDKQDIPVLGDEIDLYISINQPGITDYSLTFDVENKPNNLPLFLKDEYLATETVITADFVYDFTIDYGIPASLANDRFTLVFDYPVDHFLWIAEFDDNYGNTRIFTDAAFGDIKTLSLEATSADDEYLIYYGGYNPKWRNGTTPFDAEFSLFYDNTGTVDDGVMASPVTSGNYYTVQIDDFDLSDRPAVIMETDNLPVEFDATNPISGHEPYLQSGQDFNITVNLENNKSPQEKAFVRYSDDGFTTSDVVEVTFGSSTASTGTATIPAVYNTTGKTVEFYVFTTTVAATAGSNHDLISLHQANNGGANYSYTVLACCFTVDDGNFNQGTTWVGGSVPPPDQDIIIQNNVVFNQSYQANSVEVTPSGEFTDLNTSNFILTIRNNGSITNNGVFNFTTGTIQFDADATINGSNPRIFNNVDLFNFGSTTGVDFGSATTVNGVMIINNTAFVDVGSPIYGPNSTLRYNTGGLYNRRSEWSNTAGPQGDPVHVVLVGGTELNLGSENKGNPAVMSGDLTINNGASLYMDVGTGPGSDDMEHPLRIGGDFNNDGTIILSDLPGGDLVVEGDFTDNGTITYNNRAVFFEGPDDQQLVGDDSGGSYFMDVVRIDKPSGEVFLNQATEINKTADPLVMSDQAILNINDENLILGEPGTSSAVTFNGNAALRGSETSILTLKGAGIMGDLVFDDSNDGVTNLIGNIYLERDSGSTVGLANTLYLKEGITLDGGTLNSNANLVFVSDASNTAIVREVPASGGEIADDVVIQRHFPLSNRAFRYISSSVTTPPVVQGGSIHDNWQEGATDAANFTDPYNDSDFNPNAGFGTHITGESGTIGTLNSNGLDRTHSGNPSLYEFDETNQTMPWIAVTNTVGTTIEAGKPYALMVRGDRSAPLNSNTAQGSNPATLRTTGTILTRDQVFNSTISSGEFAMVGNPYQARVDMNTILGSSTGFNPDYMWIWDPTIGSLGGYAVVDLSTGDSGNAPGNPIPGYSDANQFLQPFQACLLEANGNSPSLTFIESAKSNSAVNIGTFSENIISANTLDLELYRTSTQKLFDAVRLKFSNSYTTEKSYEDATKLWNNTERLAIINTNNYLSIDKRNLPQTNDTIPLYLGNYQTIQYTLKLSSSLSDDIEAYLYDHYLEQTTAITDGTNIYNFSIDQNIPESMDVQRFELIFNPQTLSTSVLNSPGVFSVYPNPAKDKIYLQATGEVWGQKAQISCFDPTGRLVLTRELENMQDKTPLDLSALASGLYLLKLETTGHQETFKIQIE